MEPHGPPGTVPLLQLSNCFETCIPNSSWSTLDRYGLTERGHPQSVQKFAVVTRSCRTHSRVAAGGQKKGRQYETQQPQPRAVKNQTVPSGPRTERSISP